MQYCDYFKNKKITLLGLGVLGRGVGDAEFLAECGAELTVTDLKTEQELSESVERLKKHKNIRFVLGEHQMDDFRSRDMVIKAAGVPLDSPYIAEARKQGIPIEMSTALFAALSGAYVIGVTGTRGKTTVAHLLYEILKKTGKRVVLGGNVRGVSTLTLLKEVKKGDYAVLELDSWQLQGFGERRLSPQMAIFTNFMPDHMNYYKGDTSTSFNKIQDKSLSTGMNAYWRDKEYIFKYQKTGDYLITTKEFTRYIEEYGTGPVLNGKMIIAKSLPEDWKLKVAGGHNRQNCAAAVFAARALTIPEEIIRETVENFKGVSGRLEFLREINGVKIYNDTTATTPDATVAALKALRELRIKNKEARIHNSKFIRHASDKHIVLIVGGADKGLEMSGLAKEIPKYCKAVIFLTGTGTEKLISNFQFPISNQFSIFNVSKLEQAVRKAMEVAEGGDVLLFSPAFASFGLFKNEFDRGQQFIDIIKKL